MYPHYVFQTIGTAPAIQIFCTNFHAVNMITIAADLVCCRDLLILFKPLNAHFQVLGNLLSLTLLPRRYSIANIPAYVYISLCIFICITMCIALNLSRP